MNLTEMKQDQKAALDAAESIVRAAEQRGGNMTQAESENYNAKMAEYHSISRTIQAREGQNTIRNFFRDGKPTGALLGMGQAESDMGLVGPVSFGPAREEIHSAEYRSALLSFLRTGGKAHNETLTVGADGVGGYVVPGSERFTRQRLANGTFPKMNAATYEGTPDGGSGASGGYAISVPTWQQVVPLAMPDLGIWDASTVIPTATALKIPVETAFGTSAIKAESTGTLASFGGSDPTLGQIELDAYMVGASRIASWELLQDVEMWQSFIVDDLLRAQRITEGALLATGTGSSQPQGVFGNTGTGTGTPYQLTGASTDGQLLLDSLFDVTSTLKAGYQPGAVWVMARATGLAIRRAQMQANLFIPVATVDPDGTERILGKPVMYDFNAPALPTATTAGVVPILLGDFKQGYIIGVRGGSGINVKVLDQPLAMQGQLAILAYRRIDAKVRRSEAIQAVTISHS